MTEFKKGIFEALYAGLHFSTSFYIFLPRFTV